MKILKPRKAQISMEYLIILSFVTFVVITVLGIALIFNQSMNDRVKITQVNNFANKIVSSAESVYYKGEPSKITIIAYIPEGVSNINISNNDLYITTKTASGTDKSLFTSDVPIEGTIQASSGVKRIVIRAEGNKSIINSI
jgi:uncharacterized protein (UPF0333 family)